MATDYNLLGSTDVLEELQEGRTRELLLLLQDKPAPEVQDPLNIQTSLSANYNQVGDDYELIDNNFDLIEDFEDGDISVSGDWTGWNGDTGPLTAQQTTVISGDYTAKLDVIDPAPKVNITRNSNSQPQRIQYDVQANEVGDGSGRQNFRTQHQNNSGTGFLQIEFQSNGDIQVASSNTDTVYNDYKKDTTYRITIDNINWQTSFDLEIYEVDSDTQVYKGNRTFNNGVDFGKLALDTNKNYTSSDFAVFIDDVRIFDVAGGNDGYVTSRFAAPTTAPADFKAWNAIQARDVTVGGSTSADPVEFEILDSTDTALNSSKIPKARIADEPFTMRNRVYSEDAGSNGQSDFTINTTGDGGHFGIPVLTVVSVKKNGSVLNSADWSFDGTDTVTIDTSNVTIASGDTIDITYDFDVFDSTLQPRAYLSREESSETSPSISHFRYEYLI